ncbi:MAG: phosphate signaling complex protein PhoU [Proteobacteria bacterium]|nr:phosphate signaling complex protein PhoU [Pseudomonadota bacterium]
MMVQRLQGELNELKKILLKLAAIVEDGVILAVKSIAERDAGLATRIIDEDIEIDHMEVNLEEDCLKLLALYQPVAIDLRFIVAALKINNDLERIGDLSVNIAERTVFLVTQEKVDFPFDFPAMAETVKKMVRKSLDAFVKIDKDLAHEVLIVEEGVDLLHRDMYGKIEAVIRTNPAQIQTYISLLGVSRNLERIADHATNIAEDVIYMAEGRIIRHGKED